MSEHLKEMLDFLATTDVIDSDELELAIEAYANRKVREALKQYKETHLITE